MKNSNNQFTAEMVKATLQAWCNAVVATGKVYSDGGDVKAFANQVLTEAYDYDKGKVVFKPTLTWGEQTFRPTKDGALSYFVGKNPSYPNDHGFLLEPWTKVWFTNEDFILNGNLAIVQCNIYFISAKREIFVNKSFVFRMDNDGKVKICLHHSSLPYNPD
ncbi:MAG: hypothetical protein FJ343_03995 [Sphingomonadales bacterium]|nr:hypothetical protein [Sphingomonadales bacterium]